MLPWREIGRSTANSGGVLVLAQRGDEFCISIDGWELMSNRAPGSEEAMADVGCKRLADKPGARVLVAGLGLGYSLRATLNALHPEASVTVAEFVPEIIAWNRGPLGPLAGHPLDDPRVTLFAGDVRAVMEQQPNGFDAILLDTDNGPQAFIDMRDEALYSPGGLRVARQALRPGGTLVIWSGGPDPSFEKRMRNAGFQAESIPARARAGGRGARHILFTGLKR